VKVPVCEPFLDNLEEEYVLDAIKKGELSGNFGKYITSFEEDFSRYSDCKFGVTTNSGTTALHLAVASLGINEGDEVLVSTYTNMATFFSVIYQNARPIPIDIDADTFNIDPQKIQEKITSKTKAIIVVHLFGHPADMDPIIKIAKDNNLVIIEDCAEAHGAQYKGKKVGSLGEIGCFSFYANKIITTGEGGMLTINNPKIAEKARSLRSLSFGIENKFKHQDIGFSYRMTNMQAALGCAQMQKIDEIIKRKREIASYYNEKLQDLQGIRLPQEKDYAKSVNWMYHIVLEENHRMSRDLLMSKLAEKNIETRKTFVPFTQQDIFKRKGWVKGHECPIGDYYSDKGLYLPTGATLTSEMLDYVVQCLYNIQILS